ncbi:putative plant disease resistance response protein [Rosa chinensis]|uniref:Dirigent protein n=1 Tax=Rosa chinensis TaxID=74649 RepID=A0A2P6S251_ROSCH|nr:dirigent protein 1 [Rosa chinensis]PRQ52757.1 putative plant disease resistance response protein [Rosa chinensis]
MALNLIPKLLLVLVLSMTTFSAIASSSKEYKETHMSMFLQDFLTGPNVTDIPVAGVAGKLWAFNQFGTLYVNDNPLTEGPSPQSAEVGRAPGIFMASALDGSSGLVAFSVVFTNKEYNGSTIEILGNSKILDPVRELSVASGTGKFRFARGYATLETYFLDIPRAYSIVRLNITVEHK